MKQSVVVAVTAAIAMGVGVLAAGVSGAWDGSPSAEADAEAEPEVEAASGRVAPDGPDTGETSPGCPAPDDGTTAAEALGYQEPAFADDFDAFDENRWTVYTGPSAHVPGQFEPVEGGQRTREQISVADGVLTITGLPNGDTGGISTEGSHLQQYGLWEARVRLPAGATDYHSVLILLTGDADSDTDFAELDFMEVMDPAGRRVDGFLHTPGGEDHGQVTLQDNGWHNWAIEWTPDGQVRLYLDGELWHEGQGIDVPEGPGPMTIQLDWFPGDEGETAEARLQVDWVRIYEARTG